MSGGGGGGGGGSGEFLGEANHAGQVLLKLVSRGNALLAELLRLSQHIPEVFLLQTQEHQQKFGPLLPDFGFLKNPDVFDYMLQTNSDLVDLDENFKEANLDILERFYLLFEGIWKYASDYNRYLDDLAAAVFIQYTFENVLVNTEGKQLLAEGLYLFGVMLLLMDELMLGVVRERLIVAYYRYKNNTQALSNVDEVCRLFRATGFVAGERRPERYPEELFARFALPQEAVKMLVGRLRTEDIYSQISSYPDPDHRSTALSVQAGMLYVMLYFVPDTLRSDSTAMREIVDKHFEHHWIVPYYLGFTVDLSVWWDVYPAARLALTETIDLQRVRDRRARHVASTEECNRQLQQLLTEGVLTEEYVLDNIAKLLAVLRKSNVTLRWLLLHATCRTKKLCDMIRAGLDYESILVLLLNVAQFEYVLQRMFKQLLESKEERWAKLKGQASEHLRELGEYFSGDKPLAKVQRDEHLMKWFMDLSGKVAALDYKDSTLAGRRIQQISNALLEVEQFNSIETNLQVRQFLADTRTFLHHMVRTVYIKEDVLSTLQLVSDLSYAQRLLEEFIPLMQARIRKDPFSVIKLRSTFLKLASVLVMPLIRIGQCRSPDFKSVSEFFSGELVEFVRRVLEIIPRSMFERLNDVIEYQTRLLRQLPNRFEREQIRDYAQLDHRLVLSRATHAISVFAEGICSMEATLVGVIEVKPQQLLEEGIRRELVRRLTLSLHEHLQFVRKGAESNFESRLEALASFLHGFCRSFEYIQDYISVYGLKIWQEEFARIIEYSVEQECNRFLKLKVMDYASAFQSEAIPIPRLPRTDEFSVNFVGRVSRELLLKTDPKKVVYAPQMAGWYDPLTGKEVAGLYTFSLLHRSLSVWGLVGVDRFYGFSIAQFLQQFIRLYRRQIIDPFGGVLRALETSLEPTACLPSNPRQVFDQASQRMKAFWKPLSDIVQGVGQRQLLRRHIANELNLSCQLDSSNLASTLSTMNDAVWNDMQAHYRAPGENPYPGEGNTLLSDLSSLLERTGIHNPFMKIYITADPIKHLALVMCIFVFASMPRFQYQREFATMVGKKKEELDGQSFVIGVGSVLHQFHRSIMTKFVAYLGQFIRASISFLNVKERTAAELPSDIVQLCWFLHALARNGFCEHDDVAAYVPTYILDNPLSLTL